MQFLQKNIALISIKQQKHTLIQVLTFFAVFTNIHKKLGQVKLNLIFYNLKFI